MKSRSVVDFGERSSAEPAMRTVIGTKYLSRAGLEVIHFHRQRKIGERIVERERVFELPFFIARIHLAPDFGSVIPFAVIDLRRFRQRGDLHRHMPVLSVLRRVRAVVAENVVTADVGLDGLDAERQVVAVEQSFSAGVGGQRVDGVLRVVKRSAGAQLRAAGEHPRTFGRCLGRIAGRRHGHQAARIDGIKRHVGAHRGVHSSANLRLIVDAGLADAARKINQRLLFRERRQFARGIFECAELAIGIENVELGIVGSELAAVVGGDRRRLQPMPPVRWNRRRATPESRSSGSRDRW